jgi:5'-nucleotidase
MIEKRKLNMLNILVSNDDGVYAPGITILAEGLAKIADVSVVAPDRDRSGASNSLTLDAPLRVKQLDNGYYFVQGTPTDCVHLATTGLLPKLPDLVVSGINDGANLGDDIFYSGTVAAAMEGRFMGLPALALSLIGNGDKKKCFQTGVTVAKKIIQQLLANPLPKNTILNINIPNLPYEQLNGFEITRLGTRHRAEQSMPAVDPRGHTIYWIGPPGFEQDAGPGTDFYAVAHNRVSITPVLLDLTNHQSMLHLQQWADELTIHDEKI